MSNTGPIPGDKPDIAVATAMAGEMLGLKSLYLEAGSGASHIVEPGIIRAIRKNISLPLIVGGGIRSVENAEELFAAGADMIVVGNALEKDPELIKTFCQVRDSQNSTR
jgi:putative glycerol-1-phosphate prenyltransferase